MRSRSPALAFGLTALAAPAAALADGTPLPLDPGTNFMLYTMNTNDGYSSARGMVFTADEAITINGAALFTEAVAPGLNATFEVWDIPVTNGDVLVGAVLLRSVATNITGPLDYYGAKFPDLTLVPGEDYLVRVQYAEAAAENWFYDFDPIFFGDPPVDIGPVTLIDGTLGGNTSNFVAPPLQLQLVGAGGDVNFFTDPAAFQEAIMAAGKVSKAFWDFKPNNLPPAAVVALDDPQDINTHSQDPDDPWTIDGVDVWPPELDNVQFSSNTTPQGPLTPMGIDGLAFASPGFAGNENNVLVANFPATSLDIVSGPPAGDNHTAIAVELVDFFGGGLVIVTVYDKEDLELAQFEVTVPPPPAKAFLGILRKNRETIGRVDIWDPNGNFEAISFVEVYENAPPPGECSVFTNKDEFEAFNQGEGKFLKGVEDFECPVSNLPPASIAGPLADPLVGGVPNVDAAGLGFPAGLLNDNLIMQSNLLGPNAPQPAPGGGLVALSEGFLGGLPCPWDLNGDRIVGVNDLILLLSNWGPCPPPCPPPCLTTCPGDFNGDCVVGINDLIKLLSVWGPCPQPQAVPNSVVVGSNTFADSTDLIFPPGDNHTGIGFDVIDPIGLNTIHITVFNKQEVEIAKLEVPGSDQKTFFGIWCVETIGRINIAGIDPAGGGGGELLDNIQLWQEETPQANCDTPGVCGTYQNCQNDPNCFCFTLADGTAFCGQSVSCAGLTPCPDGTCPPGFVCQVSTCCPDPDICVPVETKCEEPAAAHIPLPPGTLTTMGIVGVDVPAWPHLMPPLDGEDEGPSTSEIDP